MKDKMIVSGSPHIHTKESVSKIMWMVTLSLLPAGAAGVIIFGLQALWVILFSVIAAVAFEAIYNKLSGNKITITDGSAFLTGLLLAYNLPAGVPLWMPVIGAIFAIYIGKLVFGGLGRNIFNPALAGRAFLTVSWAKYMTTFPAPFSLDAVSQATPLALLKKGEFTGSIPYFDLFIGHRGGCIGEVCIAALLVGIVFLLIKGYISWQIPVSYILTTGVFLYIFGPNGFFSGDWFFHVLSGGLILGAFFMATDYVTSPLTQKGQIVFGIGCGLLTAIIRLWGGYPEGACYAILIMNAIVPFIDSFTRPRIYGTVKE